jgi:hypothetical protein
MGVAGRFCEGDVMKAIEIHRLEQGNVMGRANSQFAQAQAAFLQILNLYPEDERPKIKGTFVLSLDMETGGEGPDEFDIHAYTEVRLPKAPKRLAGASLARGAKDARGQRFLFDPRAAEPHDVDDETGTAKRKAAGSKKGAA